MAVAVIKISFRYSGGVCGETIVHEMYGDTSEHTREKGV